ncbi:MAG: prenyltransferase/squalene oxidase repeat-containing protein [Gemmataceae bacterium]
MKPFHSLFVLLMFAVATRADKPAKTPDPLAKTRQAVAKSLPFLEKQGVAWMTERKCIACHHGAFLLWSHNEAKVRGIAVDEKKLAGFTRQALDLVAKRLKTFAESKNGGVESAHMLLSQAYAPRHDEKTVTEFATLGKVLLASQKPDGFWKYEGQTLKRPDAEGDSATTLWAVFALAGVEKSPEQAKVRDAALAWLGKGKPGDGTEALALRVILEHERGAKAAKETLLADLLSRQNKDGSWSWSKGWKSDTHATGQVLYALARIGLADTPAAGRARDYLLAGQRDDGSWFSPTHKPEAKDNPIALYWGSAWASIGLARTLPEVKVEK